MICSIRVVIEMTPTTTLNVITDQSMIQCECDLLCPFGRIVRFMTQTHFVASQISLFIISLA